VLALDVGTARSFRSCLSGLGRRAEAYPAVG
jgi:hypothetical protein